MIVGNISNQAASAIMQRHADAHGAMLTLMEMFLSWARHFAPLIKNSKPPRTTAKLLMSHYYNRARERLII